MAMNEGLKKYSDHNRKVKLDGGVDQYERKIYNQGYSKGLGNRIISFGEDAIIISTIIIGIGKIINKIKEKKYKLTKKRIEEEKIENIENRSDEEELENSIEINANSLENIDGNKLKEGE